MAFNQLHRAPFPQNPEEFDGDERVSFSKVSNRFVLETEDGAEYEYDSELKRWVEVLDDALLEQQSKAYAVQGVDENEPAAKSKKKKRKPDGANDNDIDGQKKKQRPDTEVRERKNTAVYITNLPLDADEEEVRYVFSKCGVIAEEIDSGKPRVKLYEDEHGKFKGDALIVYFRAESVDLAIQMLDDTDFRLGQGMPAGRMKVAVADFSYKKQTEAPAKSNIKDKQKIIKRTQKLNNKLADWDDDDPSAMQEVDSRWDKVVILKHMFTLDELAEDPAAMLDIKEDIREECSKLGEVTNVVLYDKEKDGVVSVRFSTPQAARACIRMMNGRFFSGTQVEAYTANGKERFAKSNSKKLDADEDEAEGGDKDAEDAKRIDKFGEWLKEGEEESKVDDEAQA